MIQTVLKVRGMSCQMCQAHVNETVRAALPEIKSVKSDAKKGETTIISESALDIEKLKRAVAKTGYEVLAFSSEPYIQKSFLERLTHLFK